MTRATTILASALLCLPLSVAAAEPSPEDLGMLDSPRAFVDVCMQQVEGMPAEVRAARAGVPKEVLELSDAVWAISGVACSAVVRGVAAPLTSGEYRYGGKRICLDPKMDVASIVRASKELADKHPDVIKDATTPEFVLAVLISKSKCNA